MQDSADTGTDQHTDSTLDQQRKTLEPQLFPYPLRNDVQPRAVWPAGVAS